MVGSNAEACVGQLFILILSNKPGFDGKIYQFAGGSLISLLHHTLPVVIDSVSSDLHFGSNLFTAISDS